MKKQTRQERRAEAREKARTGSVGRVDPALMQVVATAQKQLEAAKRAASEAQSTINMIGKQVRESHGLIEGDLIDLATGLITRVPRSKRKS